MGVRAKAGTPLSTFSTLIACYFLKRAFSLDVASIISCSLSLGIRFVPYTVNFRNTLKPHLGSDALQVPRPCSTVPSMARRVGICSLVAGSFNLARRNVPGTPKTCPLPRHQHRTPLPNSASSLRKTPKKRRHIVRILRKHKGLVPSVTRVPGFRRPAPQNACNRRSHSPQVPRNSRL